MMDWWNIAESVTGTVTAAGIVCGAGAAWTIARSIGRMERTLFGDEKAKQKGLVDRIITLETQANDWDRRRHVEPGD